MKKLMLIILMGFFFNPLTIYAEEQSDTMSFWERLRIKLESFTPQKMVTATNATGGVRGAEMASEDIYWKDDASGQTIDSDELDEFKKAMALIDSGNKKLAQAAFSEFIKKYPDSPLRKDADQALAYVYTP